jgi:probable addiction module antidote protein
MKSINNDEAMADLYRRDPGFAIDVLNSVLEDGEQGELLILMRQLTRAFGGVQAIAEQARLNPTQLYRTLSPKGNPALSSFRAILKAMNLRLQVSAIGAVATQ